MIKNGTLQLNATGKLSDGSTQDLTSSASWSSSATSVASINNTGFATAAGIGSTTITASSGAISGNTTLSVTQPVPRFAFTANSDGTVSEYVVNAGTGQLRLMGYVLAGSSPNALTADPSGKFLYVSNGGSVNGSSVSGYAINSTTGSLTPLAGSPFGGGRTLPMALTVDPSGHFLFLVNNGCPGAAFVSPGGVPCAAPASVSVFTIDPVTGALTTAAGSPFTTGANATEAAVDGSGKYVAVAFNGQCTAPAPQPPATISFCVPPGGVSAFMIGVGTGGLTQISGSPFPGVGTGNPLVLHPSGKFVYEVGDVSLGNSAITAYAFNPATGVPAPVAGSPFTFAGLPPGYSLDPRATVDPVGRFLFTGSTIGTITFAVNAVTGALTAGVFSGTVINPGVVTIDPSGQFAYTTSAASVAVPPMTASTVDPSTGALTPVGTAASRSLATTISNESVYVASGSAGANVTPQFAYVANTGSNNVSVYTVNAATGALTSAGTVAAGTAPASVAADPSGKFLFVANKGSNNVSVFTINSSTGALTAVGAPITVGTAPASLAVDLSGRFLYVLNSNSAPPTVSAFSIDSATGALTQLGTSPYSLTGVTAPVALSLAPAGGLVYVTGPGSNNLAQFAINPLSGALTAAALLPIAGTGAGSECTACTGPVSVTPDPSGYFAYVTNQTSNNVAAFGTFSSSSGGLNGGNTTQFSGSPYTVGNTPAWAAFDPYGKFFYVANKGSNSVSAFTRNGSTGVLTAVPGPAFTAGTNPVFVAVDPSGKFVYAVNNGSNNVSVFSINATTGALTPTSTPTFATGTSPTSIVITAVVQ